MHDVTSALEYWPSPPPWGWTADDLDRLPSDGPNGEPDFFKHVELIDGVLAFMPPQKLFHECVISGLRERLNDQAPDDLVSRTQMDIKLDHYTRFCPDVLVVSKSATSDLNRTYFDPAEVRLVVEVVSPESAQRDRARKPPRYAEAGIAHFWRVEEKDGRPATSTSSTRPPRRTR